jgi:hypothetical protein
MESIGWRVHGVMGDGDGRWKMVRGLRMKDEGKGEPRVRGQWLVSAEWRESEEGVDCWSGWLCTS